MSSKIEHDFKELSLPIINYSFFGYVRCVKVKI